MTNTTTQRQLQHLYWRAGFGPTPEQLAAGLSPQQALRKLLQDSRSFEPLDGPAMRYAEPLPTPSGEMMQAAGSPQAAMVTTPDRTARPAGAAPDKLTPEQRKQQNQNVRSAFYAMNTGWLTRMATSEAQLREKLTFFWHGHFACRVRRPDAALQLNNTIRRLALGKFPDLLLAVSREPAMLQFLNNQQNRKQHPNENFAREVMELFTLGRGNYSETDVKEAARAFTGWGYNGQGKFVFREKQHDDGPKTLLGRTGNFSGEQALEIILAQPACAAFITTKLYRFFVNDVPNPEHIRPLAQAFFRSGYDIAALLEQLFSADWFYAAANVGTRIKSPVELLAGMKRTLGLELANERPLIVFQKALGQTLFQPPNVAGWPGGRAWIDSSSLLYRLQLPAVLLRNAAFDVQLKQDENDLDPNLPRAARTFDQAVKTTVRLAPLQRLLAGTPAAQQPARLSEFLLQVPIRPENLALVRGELRDMTTALLSLPEYQLM
ncbi:DUF1800 domain-containing protein [Hymenobacter psychrophilus]|uniref:Uncharacterized conserved protein, DUF1800 family n=1 Tax=Hymenobacter psychrophilus TaxID=651662 RepID=A0A1H3ET41_9BACT|nr:DUF1800 domain-containing protein [Hymenobacter psychrophilus]SDX81258.1 Uncharacterized conserved protein, DUF1800 family [Hymenobacter psychrophilus]